MSQLDKKQNECMVKLKHISKMVIQANTNSFKTIKNSNASQHKNKTTTYHASHKHKKLKKSVKTICMLNLTTYLRKKNYLKKNKCDTVIDTF